MSIISACGNDCSICPRYNKELYVKSEEELHEVAKLWHKIGYRDHIVSNSEISCSGCNMSNWCRYKVVSCAKEHNVNNCGLCSYYPCDNIKECFEVTCSFEPKIKEVCTKEEYDTLRRAFFEKRINLDRERVNGDL